MTAMVLTTMPSQCNRNSRYDSDDGNNADTDDDDDGLMSMMHNADTDDGDGVGDASDAPQKRSVILTDGDGGC